MQVTLSRQTSRNLQYFVAYTYGKTQWHARRRVRVDRPLRCRRARMAFRPGSHAHPERLVERLAARRRAREDGQLVRPRVAERLAAVGHLVVRERHPVRLSFSGAAGVELGRRGYFGTADVVGPALAGGNGLAPVYTCDPTSVARMSERRSSTSTASASRRSARTATWCRHITCASRRGSNHDLTLFKNFTIKGEQKLQFRVGFFNMFNQAFATTAVDRQRHQPRARHDLQRHAGRRAERPRRHAG